MFLDELLASKPLYYKVIDHDRIKIAFDFIKPHISIPKVVQIVGTNGKGTTGRMIAHLMSIEGINVGHYTSPHILSFNERYWLNGANCNDEKLENAHDLLYAMLPQEISTTLSYFEYTTLLALFVFKECDYIIFEAGMGGEYDATSVVPKILSVVTPIDIDHQAFLGSSIQEIATTKLKSIDKVAVIAPQVYNEINKLSFNIAPNAELVFVDKSRYRLEIEVIARENSWGGFLIDNANTACVALDTLNIKYNIDNLKSWSMNGRYFAYRANIRIDVGHNMLAAKALFKMVDKPVILVYNSLDDKPYKDILELFKPKIDKVSIIDIDNPRAVDKTILIDTLNEMGVKNDTFDGTIDSEKQYLVFGSFSVVEAFLMIMEKDEK